MNIDIVDPASDNENEDRDRIMKNELGETAGKEDLNYNADEDSFEYDVKSDDPDYQHPDPYNTAAKNGEDFNSTFDEANQYDTSEEYISNESLVTDVDKLAMHIDDGQIVELDAADKALAHTPEDDRTDLDEEGYPINDTPNK
jgi:hypothetical protein